MNDYEEYPVEEVYEEWHFPSFMDLIPKENSTNDVFPHEDTLKVELPTDDLRSVFNEPILSFEETAPLTHSNDLPAFSNDLLQLPDEATELRHQLELKEALIDEKIAYLDSMGLKLSEQFAEAETSLLKNTVHLIKKTARKIILKEIEVNENLLAGMISQAMENVDSKEHPCVIYVSKLDMKHTENNIFLSHVQFKVNEMLNQGDFVIENKFFSLEAILDDRINRLFNLVES